MKVGARLRSNHICYFGIIRLLFLLRVGYPESQPIASAKAPDPGTLNKGRMIGVSSLPMMSRKGVAFNKSIQMKNGNKDGITLFAQSFKAFCATSNVLEEKQTIQIMINNIKIKTITLIKSM